MQPFYIYKLYPRLDWEMNDENDLVGLLLLGTLKSPSCRSMIICLYLQIVREAFRSVLYLIADTDTLESRIPKNATKEMLQRMKHPQYSDTNSAEHTKLAVQMISIYGTIELISNVSQTFAKLRQNINSNKHIIQTHI